MVESSSRALHRITHSRPSAQDDPEFSITFEDNPRRYTIIRQFWHVWRAKAIRRQSHVNSRAQIANRHYRHILLPLTFETWREKWRYFAVLQRRVERDRARTILTRCLTWWRYRATATTDQNERIHNEVVLRRMFRGWLRQTRLSQERLNSITLSNVLECWKAQTSTKQDLQTTAERWSRHHTLRKFWKEWFFRTCSVKTVQYYEIKLKQRLLVHWAFRTHQVRDQYRRSKIKSQRRLARLTIARWKMRVNDMAAQSDFAQRYWQTQTLHKALDRWRLAQQASLRAGLLRDQIENRLVFTAWVRWRDSTYDPFLCILNCSKTTIHANAHADWKLLKASFKSWRHDAASMKLENSINRECVRRTFTYWKVQLRGVLLGRLRDHRFLQEAMEIWRERFEGMQEVLDSTLEIVETSRTTKILWSSLQIWRERLAIRTEERDLGMVTPNILA